MADIMRESQLQPQPQPQPLPRTGVQEGLCVNRGAIASMGFLAGWLPINCCSIGLVPAVFSGLGFGTAYFALGNTMLLGLGWTPIWAVISIALVMIASYFLTRRAFATHSREVATRFYWRTSGLMLLAAGLSFIIWMELIMPLLFISGVPMGALFR